MVDSFSNLIIETIGSDSDVLNSAAAFEMGWDHELMQRIQCCIYALINITRIAIDEYCSFGLWMCCSVRWKPSVSELADGACCKREESMNKVHSLLNNSKSSMTNHKNRSVGILLHGSEPQEDTSLKFEGYWNAKHPGGIAIKIKICTSWTEIPGSEGQCWILGLKNVKCWSTKIPHHSRRMACAVLTTCMRSITLIERSTDRSWSDCLRYSIVVGALTGESWPHCFDENFTHMTSHE